RRPRVGGGLYHLRGEHRRLPGPDEPVCPLRLRRGTGGILPGRGRAHLLPRRGDAGGGGAAGPA
ncbi:Inhibitor of sigma-G Gin, partial [Dysosmobacter welbionis]